MAQYTLIEAQTMLALYIEAEKKVLTGQSYSIGDRALTRADLEEIKEGRKEWAAQVENLTAGRDAIPVTGIIPRDG